MNKPFVMPKQFAVRTHHDHGYTTIHTFATDKDDAKRAVMVAEKCPERSILSVKLVRDYPTKTQLIERARMHNVEVFRVDARDAADARRQIKDSPHLEGELTTQTGWYYWQCMPGCMPEGSAMGPHTSPLGALRAAYDNDFLGDENEH